MRTDVRLIASTHRDLKARSAEERFRADLYYRLGVFTIHLPPLRERGDDLPMLVAHFLARFNRELGRNVTEVSAEAMARLCAYSWPGNVRELQSVLKRALLQASGTVLLPGFLPELGPPLGDRNGIAAATVSPALDLAGFVRDRIGAEGGELYAETHREVDRLLLPAVLQHTHGNQREAAQVLGISRQTMRVKLQALGLHVGPSLKTSEPD